jgi:hypothetical protein
MEKKNIINRALAAKKLYNSPLTEITEINSGVAIMLGVSIPDDSTPTPPGGHPGAPRHAPDMF